MAATCNTARCPQCDQPMQSQQSLARGYCQRCAWTVPGLQRPTYPPGTEWLRPEAAAKSRAHRTATDLEKGLISHG